MASHVLPGSLLLCNRQSGHNAFPSLEIETWGTYHRVLCGFAVRKHRMIPADTSSDIDIVKNPAREFPVSACSQPISHVPMNPPNAPQVLISAITSPATVFGRISGTIAKNGPSGAYIAPPATISETYR